jgi:hypothetical protein
MKEKALFEDEALTYAIENAAAKVGFEFDVTTLDGLLSDDLFVALTVQIAEVLENPQFTDVVEKIPNQPPPPLPQGYGLRLRTRYKQGHTESMTFFRIKDSWQSTALSLIGLGLALAYANPIGAIIPAANLVLNTWKNFVVLRRPDDSLQIETYEALVNAQAEIAKSKSVAKNPTVEDIHRVGKTKPTLVTLDNVLDGLKRLRERNLVEVASWGKNSDDYSNIQNRWRPKL